jgi:hypothetical protein
MKQAAGRIGQQDEMGLFTAQLDCIQPATVMRLPASAFTCGVKTGLE